MASQMTAAERKKLRVNEIKDELSMRGLRCGGVAWRSGGRAACVARCGMGAQGGRGVCMCVGRGGGGRPRAEEGALGRRVGLRRR